MASFELHERKQPRSGEDYGYATGAAELQALFAARFVAARRLPKYEVPHALAALRMARLIALRALRKSCAQRRQETASIINRSQRAAHLVQTHSGLGVIEL